MKLTAADIHTAIQTGQLSANIDAFRSMVNYENTDNKGYVRFTRGEDGTIKLEKFNNKLDVPLSWRSRTDVDFNREMRETFIESLKSSAKFGGAKLVERVIRDIKSDLDANGTKALSRKEIRAAFVKFDRLVNSVTGRIEIVEDVMADLKVCCRMTGASDSDFLKAIGAGPDLVKGLTEDYFATVEGFKGGAKADNSKALSMSLATFSGLIANLRGLVAAKVAELKAEDTAVSLLKGSFAAKMNGDFTLTENTVAAFRTVLANDHKADSSRPGFGYALDSFLKYVLPFTLGEKSIALKALAGDGKLTEEEIGETVSAGEIRDLFTEYLQGAIEAAEAEEAPLSDIPLAQEVDKIRKTMERVSVSLAVTGIVMANVRVTKNEAREIGAMAAAEKAPQIRLESRVDAFTSKYIKERFENAVRENPVEIDSARAKVDDFARKLTIAGQLSYGERVKIGENYYQNGYSTSGSISHIGNGIFAIANKRRGGIEMANGLSRSFANIVNRRIGELTAGLRAALGFLESATAGKYGESDVLAELDKIAGVADKFEREQLSGAVASLAKSLKSVIRTYMKRGTIGPDGAVRLEALANDILKNSAARTFERFYAAVPGVIDPKEEDFEDEALKLLNGLFKEEQNLAMNGFKSAIAAETLTRVVKPEGVKMLANPAEIAVSTFKAAMSKILDDRRIPVLTKDEILSKMIGDGKTLNRLFNRTLADELAKEKLNRGDARPGAEFANRVLASYRDAVEKLAKNYVAVETKVIEEAESFIKIIIGENEFAPDRPLGKYAKLKSSERAEIVKTLAIDVLALRRDEIVDVLDGYLAAPESHTAKEMGEKAQRVVLGFRSSTFTELALVTALEKREKRVDYWLDGRETGFSNRALEEIEKLGASRNTASAIAAKLAEEEIAAVKGRAVLDSTLSREKFDEKIDAEFAARLDKFLVPAKKFTADFTKAAANVKANYSALGAEKVDRVTSRVIGSVLKSGKLNVKAAVAFLEAELKAELDERVTELKVDFAEYSEKYERAFNRIDAEMKPLLEKIFPGDRNGLAAMVVTGFEHYIALNPDHALRPGAVKSWVDDAENAYNFIGAEADPATDEGVAQLLKECRLYGYAENPDIVKEIKAAFTEKLLKSEDSLKTVTDGMTAKIRIYFQSKYLNVLSYSKMDPKDLELEKKYNDLFELTARGFAGMKLVTRFNNLDAGEAKSLFDEWLAKYELPAPVERKAREMFAERYKTLAESAANGEEVMEPLLNSNFMTLFQELVRTDGVELTMGDWRTNRFHVFLANELDPNSTDSFMARYARGAGSLGASFGEHDHLIRIFTPVKGDLVTSEVEKATAANYAMFMDYVAAAIEKTAVRFRSEVSSGLENVRRLQGSIESVTRDNMATGFHELVRKADIRYAIARNLPALMRGVGDRFFETYLQPAFSGISAGDSARVTDATKAKYGLKELMVKIERAACDYVKARYEAIAEEAMRSVRTGDADDIGKFLEERVGETIKEFWLELNTKSGAPRLVEGLTLSTLDGAMKAVRRDVERYNKANGLAV